MHTTGSLSDMQLDLTTEAESLFHVMLTFLSLNEISLDLKTNKHISPPVSLHIMPMTSELNFLSKHIFIGFTLFFHDGKCHRCWSLIKNMIMSISRFKNPLTTQWNENKPNRISHILGAFLWTHSSPTESFFWFFWLTNNIMLCMLTLFSSCLKFFVGLCKACFVLLSSFKFWSFFLSPNFSLILL